MEDEVIATGIEDIDNNLIGEDYDGLTDDGINTIQGATQTLTLVGAASTATATAAIFDGGVRFFTITNRGGGYSSIPTVGVSSAPAGGTTAVGVATMIGGINVCNLNVNPKDRSVQAVNVVNSGAGYTVAPSVSFSGGGTNGVGAAATTTIGDGVVGIITVTSGGGGYTENPAITFTGVSTVSAAATAIVSAAGTISAIHITNAGLAYTVAPTITIAAPAKVVLEHLPSTKLLLVLLVEQLVELELGILLQMFLNLVVLMEPLHLEKILLVPHLALPMNLEWLMTNLLMMDLQIILTSKERQILFLTSLNRIHSVFPK